MDNTVLSSFEGWSLEFYALNLKVEGYKWPICWGCGPFAKMSLYLQKYLSLLISPYPKVPPLQLIWQPVKELWSGSMQKGGI